MMPAWYRPPPYSGATGLELVAIIARLHGFTAADLLGPSRVRPLCIARWCAMKALKDRGLSLSAVGRLMRRDHTSVSHGLRKLAG